MNRRGWANRIAGAADLQGEALPGQSVVELLGASRVLIERHCGLTEYGRERIQVRMKYGRLCVQGCGLELASMSAEQLIITGRIDSIAIVRRECQR